MSLFVVAGTDAYDELNNWDLSEPIKAVNAEDAVRKAEMRDYLTIRVYPLQPGRDGEGEVYYFNDTDF